MTIKIESKTQRAKLEPRREPYWQRIEVGFFLGYRMLEQGDGNWIARLREDGKQRYHALGAFADFDEAAKAARAWRKQIDQGVTVTTTTVAEVCRAYVDHRRLHKGKASADDAEGRFKRLVYEKALGKITLGKLKTTDVRKWVNDQLPTDVFEDEDLRRAKDTANRNLASLKAALNHALKDRLVATDAGWKTITPFAKVGSRRERMLSLAERNALLGACPEDLRALVKGLLLTAARPGELASAVVGDFDKRHGTLVLDGKTGRRIVPISTGARSLLADQCKGKLPGAPIFATAYGVAWSKDSWKKPFKEAVIKANLPADVVAYTLRHTAISQMLLDGMQTSLVAMLAGTSSAMIDKHYGHLQHDKTRAMLDDVTML